ncbi:MAG: glycosyl hydrolase, partial [Planctomycetota bacterium]
MFRKWILALLILGVTMPAFALPQLEDADQTDQTQPESDEPESDEQESSRIEHVISGLRLRSIGPALMSGRIADLAVDPTNNSRFFIAVASGGVWRTTDAGTTFTPVFDAHGSYSIGCVTIDPNNPNVVWVGTGENNSQRSVSFGDGVYKSVDGGDSWKNVGLNNSEHIGMITIDPRDSDIVYVAAQGPLWSAGGDRGLYKTTNGGKSWELILEISENTGVNEIHLDPRNPDTLYASSYQRRRHVWTLINGGPESAIYKSTDAGATWRKLSRGIPSVDKGRIGLAISPANPDILYAIIEAAEGKGGVFRSTDRGESWEKRSSYMATSPQYYNELVPDPHDPHRVYSLDTFLHVSENGGRTFARVPGSNRHVDDHALWIDPDNTDHMLVGCDGGLYETFNRGSTWRFCENLPITQFYKIAVDNSEPFYYVYGGTQDNATLGGPSRTTDRAGITNADWFIVVGGDGFEPQVDPVDPNIVYGQWQYGGLVRFDRRSGQNVSIVPREAPGQAPQVFNWDSPLLISPHSNTRLYFGGRRLYRSDDRGENWTAISDNLTRGIDRNTLEVMGVIQKPEAVAKHDSTSIYGNSVALSESPFVEGLIYVGTDDGLIHTTEDGGKTWRTLKVEQIEGVPELTYVSCLRASDTNADTVFATFDNHKQGDFTPYVYRSDDRGRTWTSIAGDLPERHVAYAIVQDDVDENLLFLGTEFGAFCTLDGGSAWHKLKGMPTIAARDIEIQRREHDLVIGTFGRGFYILDDYTPLRHLSEQALDAQAVLFNVRDPKLYFERSRLGNRNGRGWQGSTMYAADNPPYGAVFSFFLRDTFETLAEQRAEAQKKDDWEYPTIEQLRAEDLEREPRVLLIVRDREGSVVRRLVASRKKGFHRVAWDLRYPSWMPISFTPANLDPWDDRPSGPVAAPGPYTVELALEAAGKIENLAGPVEFELSALGLGALEPTDRDALHAFQMKVGRLQRAMLGTARALDDAQHRLRHLRQAILETPAADPALAEREEALRLKVEELIVRLSGNPTIARQDEPQEASIQDRVQSIVARLWNGAVAPAESDQAQYRYAGQAFADLLAATRTLLEWDIPSLEADLEAAGA